MFITRQDIIYAAPDVVVCETQEYLYMVKEVTEGFAIHRTLWCACEREECTGEPLKAVWVGDSEPPSNQSRYRWVYSWIGGGR